MDNEKIILFGAGKIGKKALDVIGSDYVYAFCDNFVKMVNVLKSMGRRLYH